MNPYESFTSHKFLILYIPISTTLVLPSEDQMFLQGLADGVEDGTTVELTCRIARIKPEAAFIFWSFNRIWWGGGDTSTIQNTDGTFAQENVIRFK